MVIKTSIPCMQAQKKELPQLNFHRNPKPHIHTRKLALELPLENKDPFSHEARYRKTKLNTSPKH